MKTFRLILAAMMFSVAAYAQQATVTATIAAYAGGSVVANFQRQGGGAPSSLTTSGTLNGSGVFTLSDAWNNAYSGYAPSVTSFTICATNTPATCYSAIVQIASSSQDISAAFAGAPNPGGGGGGATSFDQITSGTNTNHGLVCGSGCVISTASGGFNNANEINGATLPISASVVGTDANGKIIVSTSPGIANALYVPIPGATSDLNFLQASGTSATDSTGNGNNCTFQAGAAAPTWLSTGLVFTATQGCNLPAALNTTQTFVMALYLTPLGNEASPLPSNLSGIITNSNGSGSGWAFLTTDEEPGSVYDLQNTAALVFADGGGFTGSSTSTAGFHVLTVTCGTNGISNDHIYVDGMEVGSYNEQNPSCGLQTSGNFALGSSATGNQNGQGFIGTFYRFRTYATVLTPAQIQQASVAIRQEIAARGIDVNSTPIIQGSQFHAIGDSITDGIGATTPWENNLVLINQPSYNITNWGIGGITMDQIAMSEPARIGIRCTSNSSQAPIAVIFAGTNDFVGLDVAAPLVFAGMMGEVQTLKKAGCTVFTGTMLSRTGNGGTGATLDSLKNTYDALILQQSKNSGADGVVDFAANPLVGADGASANPSPTSCSGGPTFNTDGIHPTQCGQAILAAEASNEINYYFGTKSGAPTVYTSTATMTSGDSYVSTNCSSTCTITLPDCLGASGAIYTVSNIQAINVVTVSEGSSSQPINGLTSAIVPANGSISFMDVANPKTVAGCHWEK